MDIFSELDKDLQREVLSFILTKTIKITDAFAEWWDATSNIKLDISL